MREGSIREEIYSRKSELKGRFPEKYAANRCFMFVISLFCRICFRNILFRNYWIVIIIILNFKGKKLKKRMKFFSIQFF